MKKRNQVLSLKEISRCLGLVIGQRYQRGDVRKRCKLIALPFGSVELMLVGNGMLVDLVLADLASELKLPF